MGQMKHKPLRTSDFLRFFCEKLQLTFGTYFFLKINTRNRILLCKSNNQIKKSKTQCRWFLKTFLDC